LWSVMRSWYEPLEVEWYFDGEDDLEFICIDFLLPGHKKPLWIRSIFIHPTAKSVSVKKMMEWTNDNTILMGISTPTPLTGVNEFPAHEEHNKSNKKYGSPDLIFVSKTIHDQFSQWGLWDDAGSDHLIPRELKYFI
jgi:hypothetical protein